MSKGEHRSEEFPELDRWAELVCRVEGLEGWTCRITPGGNICIYKSKEILVTPDWACTPGMWLHEIAHALVTDDNLHSWKWGDKFTALVSKYCTPRVMKEH